MKKILLWDPRFPDRPPLRLTVADLFAAACVRSGVAAAADPADQGALGGTAIDASQLTSIIVEHGYNKRLASVTVPLAVALIGVAAGVVAGVVTPLTSGIVVDENGNVTLTEDGRVLLTE